MSTGEETLPPKEQHKEMNEKIKQLFLIHKGRINRTDFFSVIFMCFVLNKLLDSASGEENFTMAMIALPFYFGVAYLQFCAFIKRYRDIGVSGWWGGLHIVAGLILGTTGLVLADTNLGLLVVAALLAVGSMLTLGFWAPQKEDNKYGPYDPRGIMRYSAAKSE